MSDVPDVSDIAVHSTPGSASASAPGMDVDPPGEKSPEKPLFDPEVLKEIEEAKGAIDNEEELDLFEMAMKIAGILEDMRHKLIGARLTKEFTDREETTLRFLIKNDSPYMDIGESYATDVWNGDFRIDKDCEDEFERMLGDLPFIKPLALSEYARHKFMSRIACLDFEDPSWTWDDFFDRWLGYVEEMHSSIKNKLDRISPLNLPYDGGRDRPKR